MLSIDALKCSGALLKTSRAKRVLCCRAEGTTPVQRPDEASKRVIITGGNTGIGFETAKALGQKGYSTVIACRNEAKGKAALQRLQEGDPAGSFELKLIDLDDLSSVKDFSKRVCDEGRPIDVLINNAGVMACPEMATKDGFEYQLGVNHLSHFALTAGLLPLMLDPARSSRVVTVSSTAHFFGKIDFSDINSRNNYNAWSAYGVSKLANILFALELAARLPFSSKITSTTLHPGVVGTELGRYLGPEKSNFALDAFTKFAYQFLKTPAQGAATSLYLASASEVEGITGKYYIDCKPAKATSDQAYDADVRRRFWDLSSELTNTTFDVDALIAAQKSV